MTAFVALALLVIVVENSIQGAGTPLGVSGNSHEQIQRAAELPGESSYSSEEDPLVRAVVKSVERDLVAASRHSLQATLDAAHAEHVLPDPPSESLLLQLKPERLLASSYFQSVYSAERREDAAFRRRFATALASLRDQRKDLVADVDGATSDAVQALLSEGYRPGPKGLESDELGSWVGGTLRDGTVLSGWVAVPKGNGAYQLQAQVNAWRAGAIEILSRVD